MRKNIKTRTPDTELTAPFQIGEPVLLEFAPEMTGTIIKIHFDKNNVQYDIEGSYTRVMDGEQVTDVVRFYNTAGRHILKIKL